jgi:hypothetical protein
MMICIVVHLIPVLNQKGFLCLRCGVYLQMAMVENPVSNLVCICVFKVTTGM